MCDVNWSMLLEYLKVLLSWPPMALAIAAMFIFRFRAAIDDFLKRLVEGNIFGQAFKAVPPREQQQVSHRADENRLLEAAETAVPGAAAPAPLPPELANDPHASVAIAYVQNNPVETVIEYKRLLFSYNSERLFNSIYGSQIALLSFLAERPNQPSTLSELSRFHETFVTASGRTDYQLRDYVNFLVNFGAILVDGPPSEQTYRISQHGVEFLSYIKTNYATVWNQRVY